MEYTNDHSLDAPTIPTFQDKFLLQQILSGKIAYKLISTRFFLREKYMSKTNAKKTKPNKVNEAKTFENIKLETILSQLVL